MKRITAGKLALIIIQIFISSSYLHSQNILKPLNIKITLLARGLPMGSNIEYADEVTLSNAIKGRREVN